MQVLNDSRFSKIPIEVWIPLIANCKIIPIFSSSCVNLSFLFDKETILPLNRAAINKYFYPKKASFVAKACDLYLQSLSELKEWDGKSFLARGHTE